MLTEDAILNVSTHELDETTCMVTIHITTALAPSIAKGDGCGEVVIKYGSAEATFVITIREGGQSAYVVIEGADVEFEAEHLQNDDPATLSFFAIMDK